ncbi:hypothetical protein, partial [Klebsiella pneumoniae]|uniref:hypothetical protein n=1 Tax=Klebsiella pneumoniae TaxID=573 RepID=UPI001C6DDFD2
MFAPPLPVKSENLLRRLTADCFKKIPVFVIPNNSVTVAVAISVNWRSDFLTMGFLILEDTK